MKNLYKIEDELYIISLSEKIKENTQSFKEGLNGDWFYNTIYNLIARIGNITPYDFKIILTTNKLLIKDGVQAIPNEFLEWVVKNPSCEYIQIDRVKCKNCIYQEGQEFSPNCCHNYHYEIIIPQEEPKQETLEEVAEKYANKKGDIPTTKLEDAIFKQGFIDGAKSNVAKAYWYNIFKQNL